jgi:hypothetical protein
MSSKLSTDHFRRAHGQSPRALMVGAAESAPCHDFKKVSGARW